MKIFSQHRAFTLVEIIFTVAILGILSTIILSTIQQVRYKAQASVKVTELVEIEESIRAYVSDTNLENWWLHYCGGCGTDLEGLIGGNTLPKFVSDMPGFSDYMPEAPVPGNADGFWQYEYNNSDLEMNDTGCGFGWKGVTLQARNFYTDKPEVARHIDIIVDGEEDGYCGKVRDDGGTLIWQIAKTSSDI